MLRRKELCCGKRNDVKWGGGVAGIILCLTNQTKCLRLERPKGKVLVNFPKVFLP